MLFIRNNMDLKLKKELEVAKAEAETNKANLDYVVMMADIDIPSEEGNNNDIRED